MEQIVSGNGAEVEFRRGFEEQFGGGVDALRGGAGGPDTQPVEARLQLGTDHQRGGRLGAILRRKQGQTLIEAVAFQPGLQEAGWRHLVEEAERGRDVAADLVAAGLPGSKPALDFHAGRVGIAHAAGADVGEGDRPAFVDEAAAAVGRDLRQAGGILRRGMGHGHGTRLVSHGTRHRGVARGRGWLRHLTMLPVPGQP